MPKRRVVLNLEEEDCEWLENMYGDTWMERVEAHITNEIHIRRLDGDKGIKMRKPWDY